MSPKGEAQDSGRGGLAATTRAILRRIPRRARFAGAGLLVVLGALVIAWEETRVQVRLLNTTNGVLALTIDGARAIALSPVSIETAGAGVVLSLSPGRHRVRVVDGDGGVREEREVRLDAGGVYLYAPANTSMCFFVEHTAYGAAKPEMPRLRALPVDITLWRLPQIVDAWFFPTPPDSDLDRRSSGGTRTAIRQARCGFTPFR